MKGEDPQLFSVQRIRGSQVLHSKWDMYIIASSTKVRASSWKKGQKGCKGVDNFSKNIFSRHYSTVCSTHESTTIGALSRDQPKLQNVFGEAHEVTPHLRCYYHGTAAEIEKPVFSGIQVPRGLSCSSRWSHTYAYTGSTKRFQSILKFSFLKKTENTKLKRKSGDVIGEQLKVRDWGNLIKTHYACTCMNNT